MSTELLQGVYLFKELGITELVEILKLCRRESYPNGKFVFLEGDPGDKCYIIEKGAVNISKFIPSGGEERLASLRDGNYFGEMALIDGGTRSATAQVAQDTSCIVLAKKDLDGLLAANKELGNKLLMIFCRTLSARLREANEKMSRFIATTSGLGGGAAGN
jgi:CRP/FNR family cyclic AMP-dependent transcriptional regulator